MARLDELQSELNLQQSTITHQANLTDIAVINREMATLSDAMKYPSKFDGKVGKNQLKALKMQYINKNVHNGRNLIKVNLLI